MESHGQVQATIPPHGRRPNRNRPRQCRCRSLSSGTNHLSRRRPARSTCMGTTSEAWSKPFARLDQERVLYLGQVQELGRIVMFM